MRSFDNYGGFKALLLAGCAGTVNAHVTTQVSPNCNGSASPSRSTSALNEIVTRAKSSDAYESVRKAASTAKRTLARQAARLVKRRPGGAPLEAA